MAAVADLADLAAAKLVSSLIHVFFIVSLVIYLMMIADLVYPASLVMRHTIQGLPRSAHCKDLVDLLCHLLVVSQEVGVDYSLGGLWLTISTEHLTVFLVEEVNWWIQHHKWQKLIIFFLSRHLLLVALVFRAGPVSMA